MTAWRSSISVHDREAYDQRGRPALMLRPIEWAVFGILIFATFVVAWRLRP